MIKRYNVLLIALIFGMGVIFASCAAVQVKPTAANFKAPKIALEMIEVPQYDGYWYYGGKTKPTKGKAGAHSAPLPLAITFNITNPNAYPVFLDGYKFTIAFEEFDMITVKGYETQWIPAGKTNQLRATTMVTVHSGLLSLLVTGGFKLKAKGKNGGLPSLIWPSLLRFMKGHSPLWLMVFLRHFRLRPRIQSNRVKPL